MSERTVAGETSISASRTTWAEPTGWAVAMCSVTTLVRMADFRASSILRAHRRRPSSTAETARRGSPWHSIVPSADHRVPDSTGEGALGRDGGDHRAADRPAQEGAEAAGGERGGEHGRRWAAQAEHQPGPVGE